MGFLFLSLSGAMAPVVRLNPNPIHTHVDDSLLFSFTRWVSWPLSTRWAVTQPCQSSKLHVVTQRENTELRKSRYAHSLNPCHTTALGANVSNKLRCVTLLQAEGARELSNISSLRGKDFLLVVVVGEVAESSRAVDCDDGVVHGSVAMLDLC